MKQFRRAFIKISSGTVGAMAVPSEAVKASAQEAAKACGPASFAPDCNPFCWASAPVAGEEAKLKLAMVDFNTKRKEVKVRARRR